MESIREDVVQSPGRHVRPGRELTPKDKNIEKLLQHVVDGDIEMVCNSLIPGRELTPKDKNIEKLLKHVANGDIEIVSNNFNCF